MIKQVLSNNSAITIGSAVAIIATAVGIAWSQSGKQTEIRKDVEYLGLSVKKDVESLADDIDKLQAEINAKLGEMRATINYKSRDRWQRSDMAAWTRELAAKNKEIDVPAPVTITE